MSIAIVGQSVGVMQTLLQNCVRKRKILDTLFCG